VADWKRATVEVLALAESPREPSALLVDSARGRVLGTEERRGRLRAFDVRAVPGDASDATTHPVVIVADCRVVGDSKTETKAAECLRAPSGVAIEPETHWPDGTDRAAATAAEAGGLLAGQVGAGALWVTDENCIVRIDERSGAACVVARSAAKDDGRLRFVDGPGHTARFCGVSAIVWDAANERALVSDYYSHCIRAVARSPPPTPPTLPVPQSPPLVSVADQKGAGSSVSTSQWSAWTVSTLIGAKKDAGAPATSLITAEIGNPTAIALDPVRPHILYIACRMDEDIRIADLHTGTALASPHPFSALQAGGLAGWRAGRRAGI
jgi:hypothetical protein